MERKFLWSINVFDKLDHLKLLESSIREHFGDKIDIHVFCNADKDVEKYSGLYEDFFDHRPNSGHHNGVRDAFNLLLERFSFSDYDYVIFSHADNLWSDLSLVEMIIDDMEEDRMKFAHLAGNGASGAMNTKKFFGFFVDFVIFEQRLLKCLKKIDKQCDGKLWIEVELANEIFSKLEDDDILAVECESFGRTKENIFKNVMGTDGWMSASHNIISKLEMLSNYDKDLHDSIMTFRDKLE